MATPYTISHCLLPAYPKSSNSSRLNTNFTLYLIPATGDLQQLNKHEWQHIQTLLKLAEMGAHKRTAKISTEYLAGKMGISQQTSSRYLIELERNNWIQRTITPEGSLIKIADAGMKEIHKLYAHLQFLVEAAYPPSVTLEGIVFGGLGEGAYYISKEVYRKQFIEKLGFDPYPGTLNLKLTTEYDLKTRTELETYPAIEIEGFKNENRTFGLVKCYPATIDNRVKGALISALRSHYDVSVLEIIAPVCLRKQLNLRDGHKVKVEVFTLP
jgi:riboflavin kinase